MFEEYGNARPDPNLGKNAARPSANDKLTELPNWKLMHCDYVVENLAVYPTRVIGDK